MPAGVRLLPHNELQRFDARRAGSDPTAVRGLARRPLYVASHACDARPL